MEPVTARHVLYDQVVKVSAQTRPKDLGKQRRRQTIYAVFDEGPGIPQGERFLGLVSGHDLSRHSKRAFKDLIPGRAPAPVAEDAALREILERMVDAKADALPVLGEQGKFVGVITPRSLLAAWLAHEEYHRQGRRPSLEEQLQHSQKLEVIGRLAGGIAHDFNNLLTVMLGRCKRAQSHLQPDDPIRREVDEITSIGERAASLTNQLLTFSRRQRFEPKLLSLNSLATPMGSLLRRLIGENIDLVTVLDPKLGNVKADPGQIEQVIMNLVVNARDAMPRGGSLIIETMNVLLDDAYAERHLGVRPGSYVLLAVSDTGIGMSPEVREHIFEPFFTTKAPGEGTGFGLATTYGIVKQSGGTIWVYSEPGRGTTVKIYLPRVTRDVIEDSEATGKRPRALRGSETLLVVEDEEVVRRWAREVLQESGYQVLEARDGTEALEICERHGADIHLLLTDVVMPRMDGPALAERAASIRPHMKVVYMSGYTGNVIVRHGVRDVGRCYLQKPFAPEDLASRVREVLDAHPDAETGC